MKLKNKLSITIVSMLVVLFLLPFIFVNLAESQNGMGLMMLFFFVVNPITTICINSMIGKDIKKLWGIPILFSIVFLLSYWLILKEIVLDLIVYAFIYLIIGMIFMVISQFVIKK